jgi:ribose transport system permease protein
VALVTVVTMQVYRMVYEGPAVVLPDWALEPLQSVGLAWSATESPLWSSVFAVPAGVLAGGLCGLVNGLVVTRLHLSPFVATLGMLSFARGLAIWLAERKRLAIPGDRPGWVRSLEKTGHEWLFFDPGVWSLFLLAAFVFVLLRFSVFGRYVYAIGSNESTARLCGINVARNKMWIYVVAGLLTGWAGVLLFAHGNGCDPEGNKGLELEVIAAVVIGGASLAGGQGTVGGALLGVLIWGSLENALGYLDVPLEVKYILIGTFVVFNTALSRWQRKGSE